jgi:hypothetical protein
MAFFVCACRLDPLSECLEELDVSFCRQLPDAALGVVADSCARLARLHLWGCSQASGAFLDGHANDGMQVLGRGELLSITSVI